MKNFRQKKIIKILSILLIIVFSCQPLSWASHEDLRDSPGAGEYLFNIGIGYMQGRVINPNWSVLQAVAYQYLIPQVSEQAVKAMHIDNKTLAFILQVAISTLLQSRFEQAFNKVPELAAKAQSVLDEYAKNAKVAVGDLTEEQIAKALSEKGFKDLLEQTVGKKAAGDAMGEIATKISAGFTAAKVAMKQAVDEATKAAIITLAIEKTTNVANQGLDKWLKGFLRNPIAGITKLLSDLWVTVKNMFSNKKMIAGAASPWAKAVKAAERAAVFAASQQILLNNLKRTNPDLANFIAGNGAMIMTHYFDKWQTAKIGILLDGQVVSNPGELAKAISSQDEVFWRKLEISAISEAVQVAAVMSDENLRDLGVVASAVTSGLLEHSLSKETRNLQNGLLDKKIANSEQALQDIENPQAQRANLENLLKQGNLTAEKEGQIQEHLKELDFISSLTDERREQTKKVLFALRDYYNHQKQQLNMTSGQTLLAGLERGIVSVAVQKTMDVTTRNSSFTSPQDVAFFATGVTGFAQGLFVKDSNIFAVPAGAQTLRVEDLEGAPLAKYLIESAPQKRVSLSLALMDASLIRASADFASMGRMDPEIVYDERGLPSWGFDTSTRRPMNEFYLRRFVDFTRTMNEDGLGYAMSDQFTSSLAAQASSNVMGIVSGDIQKPYVQTLNQAESMKKLTEISKKYDLDKYFKDTTLKRYVTEGAKIAVDVVGTYLGAGVSQGVAQATPAIEASKGIVNSLLNSGEPISIVAKGIAEDVKAGTLELTDEEIKAGITPEQKGKAIVASYEEAFTKVRAAFRSGGAQWNVLEESTGAYQLSPGAKKVVIESAMDNPSKVTGGNVVTGYDSFKDLAGGQHDVVHWNKLSEVKVTLPEVETVKVNPPPIIPETGNGSSQNPVSKPTVNITYSWLQQDTAKGVSPTWGYDNRTGKVYTWNSENKSWELFDDINKPAKLHNEEINWIKDRFKGGVSRAQETARKIYIGQVDKLNPDTINWFNNNPEVLTEGIRLFADKQASEKYSQADHQTAEKIIIARINEKIAADKTLNVKLNPNTRLTEAVSKLANWDGKGKSPFTDHGTRAFLLKNPDLAQMAINAHIQKQPVTNRGSTYSQIKNNTTMLGIQRILPQESNDK